MNPRDKVHVRLCDRHPGASRKEVAQFKNVTRDEAVRLLALTQIGLFGTTSMWRCELRTPDGWRPFGKRSEQRVRDTVLLYAERWHPLDELKGV